jgi:hypothetical protein
MRSSQNVPILRPNSVSQSGVVLCVCVTNRFKPARGPYEPVPMSPYKISRKPDAKTDKETNGHSLPIIVHFTPFAPKTHKIWRRVLFRNRGPLSLPPNGCRGLLSPEVKRPGREADHSPPLSQHVFMAWCLVKKEMGLHGAVLS